MQQREHYKQMAVEYKDLQQIVLNKNLIGQKEMGIEERGRMQQVQSYSSKRAMRENGSSGSK